MVAQHLERRVFACALDEVHQPHVVADDEGQRQRDAGQHREHGGERIEHLHHVVDQLGRIIQAVHLVHVLKLGEIGVARVFEHQAGGDEFALAQGFPRRAVEIDALRDVVVDDLADDDVKRVGVAGQIDPDNVADVQVQRLRQLVGNGRRAGLKPDEGLVLAEVDHRLVVFQHGHQLGPRARVGAQRDGFFHQTFGGLRVGAALVAFGLVGLACEVGDHVVIQRLGVILDAQRRDGILKPQRGNNQHRAAQQADEHHNGAQLVAHQVADDHLRVEAEPRPEPRDPLQQDALAALGRLGAQQRGRTFLRRALVGVQQDEHAHHDAQHRHPPRESGDRRREPVGHFVLRDQRIPQQEGQRVVADERAQHRADGRRGDGVGEVVHLDLMRGEAQRLKRAHLHALVVDHAGEGRHDDQRGDGVGQHREDQRHVFKHLRVVVGARRAPVRGAIHNQRVGQGGLDLGLHGFAVRAVRHGGDDLRQRQFRNGAGVDEDEAVFIRVGGHAVGHDDVFRADDDAADGERIRPAAELDGQPVAQRKPL